MPNFSSALDLARGPAEVFAFLARPANLVQLAPPEMPLELVEGPEILRLGSQMTWKVRRWGISQRIVSEVTEYEENTLLTESHRQGPLKAWTHRRRFEACEAGTRLHDEIDFELPGGILGMILTADMVLADIRKGLAYRDRKLAQMWSGTE